VLGGLLYEFYMWRVSGTLWSEDEVKLLRKHYPKAKRVKLLELLPTRSWKSIGQKAALSGIRRIAKSDPLPIPDTVSLSDVQVFHMLADLAGTDTIELDERRIYVHVSSRLSKGDMRTRSPSSRLRLPNVARATRRAA
jgi:hypothetical protein